MKTAREEDEWVVGVKPVEVAGLPRYQGKVEKFSGVVKYCGHAHRTIDQAEGCARMFRKQLYGRRR